VVGPHGGGIVVGLAVEILTQRRARRPGEDHARAFDEVVFELDVIVWRDHEFEGGGAIRTAVERDIALLKAMVERMAEARAQTSNAGLGGTSGAHLVNATLTQ